MEKQRTLREPVRLSGVGLHTGENVEITIRPASGEHGYKFKRTDLDDGPIIPANVDHVVGTERGTTIGLGEVMVHTTEHVLAALYGMQVDNALIEIDGPEVPILDGSADPIVQALEAVGYEELAQEREYFVLRENITYEDADRDIEMLAVPSDEFRITVMVDYHSPVLGTQHASMYSIEEFKDEIGACRTFVFLSELEQLAKSGLIKGGDLDNAIVMVEREVSREYLQELAHMLGRDEKLEEVKVKGIGILNNSELKHQNEPARHKLLDIVGDLALMGRPVKGHILAARPGHAGNVAFSKLLKEKIQEEAKAPPRIDLEKEPILDINGIIQILPHRPPFLMVDRIMEMDDSNIIGIKNVSMNEPFFTGHFPENPVMPGVMQIEAMAQVGGIFALSTVNDPENYLTYFMKIDNAKFKKKVIPGDTIIFQLELIRPIRRGIVHMKGKAFVGNEVATEAEMMAQIVKEKEVHVEA